MEVLSKIDCVEYANIDVSESNSWESNHLSFVKEDCPMRRNVVRVLVLSLVLLAGFVAGQLSAAQPHMQAALSHLRAARRELDLASADKGGHRAKAIDLVNQAIDEAQKAMAFDRRH
jgi:hypothetical protein